jgi:hypothetical protein
MNLASEEWNHSGTPALLVPVSLALGRSRSQQGSVRKHETVACSHTSELLKHISSLLNDRDVSPDHLHFEAPWQCRHVLVPIGCVLEAPSNILKSAMAKAAHYAGPVPLDVACCTSGEIVQPILFEPAMFDVHPLNVRTNFHFKHLLFQTSAMSRKGDICLGCQDYFRCVVR